MNINIRSLTPSARHLRILGLTRGSARPYLRTMDRASRPSRPRAKAKLVSADPESGTVGVVPVVVHEPTVVVPAHSIGSLPLPVLAGRE